jgi:phospholipid/cholesterol/gamma-HCH transport system substrate-binding protein
MAQATERERALKVGLLVLGALAILAIGLVAIGDRQSLFIRTSTYFIRFTQVGGLAPGAAVTLDGVNVGKVDRVVLPRDPAQREIDVWVVLDRRYADRLRAPRPVAPTDEQATRARLDTQGLLGDKYIELNSGSEKYPPIPDEGEIPAAAQPNLEALVASGGDVIANVAQISHSLQHILARLDRGEGLLGSLTTESPASQQLRQSAVAAMQSLQRVAEQVEHGPGVLPRLVNDRALADRLSGTLARIDAVVASAEHGPGALPALLNDPGERARVHETLANLASASKDLKELTGRFASSQALVPRLLEDEAYGREVSERLLDAVRRLDTAADRLVEGNGSAARLLNDPAIYEAINNVIVGVNKSWMLRWLIQNRQKAGIRQRYEDATRAPSVERTPPAAGSPPPR